MRSNIPSRQLDRKAMREIAKEELRKQKQEFCPVCQAQMENQTIAVLLLAINKRYGWKEKGLRQVLECAKALGLYIHNTGDWYSQVIGWLKDETGIDLEKE